MIISDKYILLFLFGALPLLFLPALPPIWQLNLILLLSGGCFFSGKIVRRYASLLFMLASALFGLYVALHAAVNYLDRITPYFHQKLTVSAVVQSVNINPIPLGSQSEFTRYTPRYDAPSRYITFTLPSHIEDNAAQPLPRPTLSVSVQWKDEQHFPQAGEIWHIVVKLRPGHGSLNLGGFDSQRWSIANRLLLNGRLQSAYRLDNAHLTLRQRLLNQVLPYFQHSQYGDILLALTFGERGLLTAEHQKIMQQTGIMHLMAISGMHLLLVVALVQGVAQAAAWFLPSRYYHLTFIWAIGWLAALSYTWLSGASPPTIRAFLALTCWLIIRYRSLSLTSWQVLLRVMALLILLDPLTLLSESFWLSCYAVMCLIFLFQWAPLSTVKFRKKRYYLLKLFHLQCGLSLLMLPLQLFIFHAVSYAGLWVNLIAIPLICFITFPGALLALLASLCLPDFIIAPLWQGVNYSLMALFHLIPTFSDYYQPLSWHSWPLSFSGWLIIILYRTQLWRHFMPTILLLLALLSSPYWKVAPASWRIDMLDVGHGLAVVITQGEQAVLFDTGSSWAKRSAAEQIITPYLTWQGIQLVGIIISHQDNDHSGGLAHLQQHYPASWLISSSRLQPNSQPCLQGHNWQWQNLHFEILWPRQLANWAGNRDSCVVKISDGQFSLLLTGDLEQQQELALVEQYRSELSATFLQAPHHGSRTSSSTAFLHAVQPQLLLNSVARYNPWHLPSNEILARYQRLALNYQSTRTSGQLSVQVTRQGWQLSRYRQEIRSRWYHQAFAAHDGE